MRSGMVTAFGVRALFAINPGFHFAGFQFPGISGYTTTLARHIPRSQPLSASNSMNFRAIFRHFVTDGRGYHYGPPRRLFRRAVAPFRGAPFPPPRPPRAPRPALALRAEAGA